MKKFMALLLTLAMTASFTAVPVMAQDEDVKLKITPNVTSVDTTEETEVTYTIGVEVKNSDVKIGSIQFNLNPPEGMTLGTTKQDYKVTSALFYNEDFNPDGIFDTKFEYTPTSRYFCAVGTTEERNLHKNKTLMTIKAKIAAGTNGNLTLGATNVEFGKVDGGVIKWTHTLETTPVSASGTVAHSHTYGTTYAYDSTNHWLECTDDDCPDKAGSKKDIAEHSFATDETAKCSVCDYTRTVVISPEKPTEITLSATELTYNGDEQTVSVTNGFDPETMNVTGLTGTDVGTYTVSVTPKNHWKDGGTDAVTATWKINVLKLDKPTVNGSFNYSGTVQNATETNNNEKFITREGEVSATDAGTYNVTYSLKNTTNTTWNDDTVEAVTGDWTINKIDKETVQLSTSVKIGATKKFDLSNAVEKDGTLGEASATGDTELLETKVLEGTKLQIKAATNADATKQVVVTIPVTGAKNYNDYEIRVTVTVTEKQTQDDFTANNVTATYGDTGVIIKSENGVGDITYAVTDGADIIDVAADGKIEIKKAGTATVEVKASGDNDYAEATKTITVTVAKKELTITIGSERVYLNNTVPTPTKYTVTGFVGEDNFVTEPTLYYETTPDTSVRGSVAIKGKDADAGDNYTIKYIDGMLTIAKKSSGSSGGGSSVTTYAVTVSSADNGKVTLDKTSAAKGSVVTITTKANDGYALGIIKATDKDGKEIKLTDKGDGKYTFTMPASKVEVKAAFKQNASKPDQPAEETKTVVVIQIGSKTMFVNGKAYEKDVAPVIMNDRTLVPIRFVTESLGGKVAWNEKEKEVVLTIDGKEIKMTIGKVLEKYGVAPVILNDRTYMPVRFVADELGATTTWDAVSKMVTVTKIEK